MNYSEFPVIWRIRENQEQLTLKNSVLSKLFFCLKISLGLIFCTPFVMAQTDLLDAQSLSEEKVFESLAEALKEPEKVFILDLSEQSLASLSPEIAQLKRLQILYLNNNELAELPPEIIQLENLQWLDLYANRLSALPSGFENLKNLTHLDLGDNRFREIPTAVYRLPFLKELYVYGNRLKVISPQITQLDSLRELRLGGGFQFFFGGNRIRQLPDNFGELTNLQELYLPDNRLKKLPASFGELPRLRWLDLGHNRFTQLPPAVQDLDSLDHFTIWDRGFATSKKEALSQAHPEANINYQTDYEGNLWGVQVGFQQGKFSVVEVGIARAFKKDILVAALGLSGEFNLNGDMQGVKLSGWANGIGIFSAGMHAGYYWDEAQNNITLRPEVGLGLSLWSLNYGYNILFLNGSENINKHMVTLRLVIPFSPVSSIFK